MFLPDQDGDAVVLEHDGQLEEPVCQGVKLDGANPNLRCAFSSVVLGREPAAEGEGEVEACHRLRTLNSSLRSAALTVSICLPHPCITAGKCQRCDGSLAQARLCATVRVQAGARYRHGAGRRGPESPIWTTY